MGKSNESMNKQRTREQTGSWHATMALTFFYSHSLGSRMFKITGIVAQKAKMIWQSCSEGIMSKVKMCIPLKSYWLVPGGCCCNWNASMV